MTTMTAILLSLVASPVIANESKNSCKIDVPLFLVGEIHNTKSANSTRKFVMEKALKGEIPAAFEVFGLGEDTRPMRSYHTKQLVSQAYKKLGITKPALPVKIIGLEDERVDFVHSVFLQTDRLETGPLFSDISALKYDVIHDIHSKRLWKKSYHKMKSKIDQNLNNKLKAIDSLLNRADPNSLRLKQSTVNKALAAAQLSSKEAKVILDTLHSTMVEIANKQFQLLGNKTFKPILSIKDYRNFNFTPKKEEDLIFGLRDCPFAKRIAAHYCESKKGEKIYIAYMGAGHNPGVAACLEKMGMKTHTINFRAFEIDSMRDYAKIKRVIQRYLTRPPKYEALNKKAPTRPRVSIR